MFPLAFIEVGNTLSQPIMEADETTMLKTALPTSSSSSLSIETLIQQLLLQQQLYETTTEVTWRNSGLLENITHTSLIAGINSEEDVDGAGVSALDGFDTDSSFAYVPPLQRPETIFITILFLLIFIVGVLGNGTLVIIFFRHRSMRNIPNT